MNAPISDRPRQQGFTLIELLAVIAVMIIMSSIVIGGYFAMMSGYAIRSAMNHFQGALELAKQRASMQGQRVYFWAMADQDAERYEYVIVQQAGVVTDGTKDNLANVNIIIDEFADLASFRPQLFDANSPPASRDYTRSTLYNLGPRSLSDRKRPLLQYRFRIDESRQELQPYEATGIPAGWQIPLVRLMNNGTTVTMGDDWENGDRYGWEVAPPFLLPFGYRFHKGDRVMQLGVDYFYFNPDGTAGPDNRLPITFRIVEEIKADGSTDNDAVTASITINKNGEITTELATP